MDNRERLFDYPRDVVMVVNGRLVTKRDILDTKRAKQARELATKRRSYEPIIQPCFVWTFCNPGWLFGGWHLYIQTLHLSWQIGIKRRQEMVLKIMRLFPCGLEPIVENFDQWKPAFAATYPRSTRKRSEKQGMAMAWATISTSNNQLLDVQEVHC